MTLAEMERQATVLRSPPRMLDDVAELAELERADWKPRIGRLLAEREPIATDGVFYVDTREPFVTADLAAVTLAATDKAMYTTSDFPVLGGGYFARPGKRLKIRLFGKITTAATPGNLTISVYWGTGADANGTVVVASALQTLIAAQTSISWELEVTIRCVTKGSVGTLEATGKAIFGTAVIAAGSFLLPASAAAPSAAVDLVGANILSVQFKRSGSTVETATTQDLEVTARN
ncbi:MAG: hypothetical protein ACJ76I_11775 [Gaiellaceae bacterium]